jgi:hypothetical protein
LRNFVAMVTVVNYGIYILGTWKNHQCSQERPSVHSYIELVKPKSEMAPLINQASDETYINNGEVGGNFVFVCGDFVKEEGSNTETVIEGVGPNDESNCKVGGNFVVVPEVGSNIEPAVKRVCATACNRNLSAVPVLLLAGSSFSNLPANDNMLSSGGQ